MRIHQQVFSAHVELPCKIFCGPESLLEVLGTAVKIGPASVHLQFAPGTWQPVVGEQLRLELFLPANEGDANRERGKARYLSVRGAVAEVAEQKDGSYWLELRFRKPIFREANSRGAMPALLNMAPAKWKM